MTGFAHRLGDGTEEYGRSAEKDATEVKPTFRPEWVAAMAEPFTSQDHHVPRPDVPGHALTRRADGRLFVVVCSCGWQSEPLHLSNVVGAQNEHRIEVAP